MNKIWKRIENYDDYFEDNIPKTRLLHYEKHKRYLEKRRLGGEI